MQLTLTTAGLAALVNAENTGTDPVLLEEIGLTSTNFVPNAGMTVLPGEFKRVSTIGGDVVDDQVIHVLLRDESSDVYTLRGFALYLDDGTLFALYGQAASIMEKAAAAVLLLALDVRFSDIAAALIEFGDTNFIDPPATATRAGVVELATPAEVATGTDNVRAVTALGLAGVLAVKAPLASPAFTGTPTAPTPGTADNSTKVATTAYVQLNLVAKANLVSPAFTGTPTAPTPLTADNSTKVATTAYVAAKIAAVIASAPGALDTLQELAAALGNDANFAANVTNALALKAPLNSPGFTGVPTAPTPGLGDDSLKVATTAFCVALVNAAMGQVVGVPKSFSTVYGRVSNGYCALGTAHNVAMVYRSDNGVYAVTFTTPMASADYVVLPGCVGVNETMNILAGTKSENGFTFRIQTGQANDGTGGQDPPEFYFSILQ